MTTFNRDGTICKLSLIGWNSCLYDFYDGAIHVDFYDKLQAIKFIEENLH